MLAECLAGIKVLDLSQYIPGPFAAMWLSDMGAQVVKVEPPAGDPMRSMGPVDEDGLTAFYKLANRNKTVIRLDLKTPQGKDVFARLVQGADVLIEAYRPGVLERLGFGPAEMDRLNPRLVQCSISGYGQFGPHAHAAGHDLTYMALSGGLAVSGTVERPVMTFPPLADHAGAMLAVNAVLAGLLRRGATGKGARLDVSLAEAALSWMGGVLSAAHRWGENRRESGIIDGGAAFYRIYRTGDGRFVALAAIEEKFWRSFCTAVEREDWLYRQSEPMPQNHLIGELDQMFLTRSRDEWGALLGPADCCFEPVLDPMEAAHHPQWAARKSIQPPADSDNVFDALLPVFLDGAAPPGRTPLIECDVQQVLAQWI